MRKLLIGATLIGTLTSAVMLTPRVDSMRGSGVALTQRTETPPVAQDPIGTIDGAKTPELIPDDEAYSLFFRFVATHASSTRRRAFAAYIEHTGLRGIDADALIGASTTAQEALDALGSSDIRRGHSMSMRESEVRSNRAAVISHHVALLPSLVGVEGAEKVRRHVLEHVKQHMKMIPYPNMQSVK